MLLLEDARRQGVGGVSRKNRHARLEEDRAGVEFRRHKVNRAAMFGKPLGERALVGVEAAQIRQ